MCASSLEQSAVSSQQEKTKGIRQIFAYGVFSILLKVDC
jgi:hypothetical protein